MPDLIWRREGVVIPATSRAFGAASAIAVAKEADEAITMSSPTCEIHPNAAQRSRLIREECGASMGDALTSFDGAGEMAADRRQHPPRQLPAADRDGRLALVNRAVEPIYRSLGVDASAMVASELLEQGLADFSRTAIL